MSKPDKPGELRNVTVEAISLVSKAANGEKFKIFKSAEEEPEVQAPEVVKKDERGLFRILKEFFTGSDETVKKGEVADIYSQNESGRKMDKAFSALMKVLGLSRWDDENLTPETDSAKIVSALDDFRNVAVEILLGKTEVAKSGRKISSDRLGKLKNMQAILNDVLSGLEENKEDNDLTSEEITKAVQDAIKPLDERIAHLENVSKENTVPDETKQPQQPDIDVAEVVKNAVNEAIASLSARLEKVEKARGVSNRVPEESIVEKRANDFWGGIF